MMKRITAAVLAAAMAASLTACGGNGAKETTQAAAQTSQDGSHSCRRRIHNGWKRAGHPEILLVGR